MRAEERGDRRLATVKPGARPHAGAVKSEELLEVKLRTRPGLAP